MAENVLPNLIRHVPSGIYYARLRVEGKLICKSLKAYVLSAAKLRPGDFEKPERQLAASASRFVNSRRLKQHRDTIIMRCLNRFPNFRS